MLRERCERACEVERERYEVGEDDVVEALAGVEPLTGDMDEVELGVALSRASSIISPLTSTADADACGSRAARRSPVPDPISSTLAPEGTTKR